MPNSPLDAAEAARIALASGAASAALGGLQDGLDSLCFAFADDSEPEPRLRQRALTELRVHLSRRRAEAREGGGA